MDAQADLGRSNGRAHVLKGTFACVATYLLACEILNCRSFSLSIKCSVTHIMWLYNGWRPIQMPLNKIVNSLEHSSIPIAYYFQSTPAPAFIFWLLTCIQVRKLLTTALSWIPAPVGVRHSEQRSRTKRTLSLCTWTQGWAIFPADIWRLYNVASTSIQRHDVASTLKRRCINVMCRWVRSNKVTGVTLLFQTFSVHYNIIIFSVNVIRKGSADTQRF